MHKGVTGCLVFVLAVMASVGASGQFPFFSPDCPECNYKFDGPVPPPMVGGIATGSGFVVHPDGYILTNYHVIEGSSTVQVKVGGREYKATVVESLPAQDLALLKIEGRGLPVVALGNSDSLQVGDDVFAIGCPGGVCGTVTAGRVANTGVTITVEDGKQLQGMLMVDITTDHGSSGGPLVNSRGEVVGITTAGQQGSFGFSIPINQAIPLLRRVPGFDVRQIGQATTELPFREIRDRMTPVTAFILTDQGRKLQLPPRYDGSHWLVERALGGIMCGVLGSSSSYCFLDWRVPKGFQLLGYDEGISDSLSWERGVAVDGYKFPIRFSQGITVSSMQFSSANMAQSAVAEILRCMNSWGLTWECEDHITLVSTSEAQGPIVVRRKVAAFVENSRTDRGSFSYAALTLPYGEATLIYLMILSYGTYVIRLESRAALYCENTAYLSLFDSGFREYRIRLSAGIGGLVIEDNSGRVAQTVMSYNAFIDWATARDEELLQFTLEQFLGK